MVKTTRMLAAMAVLAVGMQLAGNAQDRDPAQPGAQGQGQAQGAGNMMSDRQIAGWLIPGNQLEIALGQLAQRQAQNDEVKKFAELMVRDHTDFIARLHKSGLGVGAPGQQGQQERRQNEGESNERAAADQPNTAGERTENRAAQPQAGAQQGAQPGAQPGQPGRGVAAGGQLDFVKIKQQIGERCLASARKELSDKEGREFDKAYIGINIFAHQDMLDTLTVLRQYASSDLQKTLDDGMETTREHLQHAKELMKTLDGEKGSKDSKDSK